MRLLKTIAALALLGGLLSVPAGVTAQSCSDVNTHQEIATFTAHKLQSGQRGQLLTCLERVLMESEQNFSNTLSSEGVPLSSHFLEQTWGMNESGIRWADPTLFKDFLHLVEELEARLTQKDQQFAGLRRQILNMQSRSGFTVLHHTATLHLTDHIKLLLDTGDVDPGIRATGGQRFTAAEIAEAAHGPRARRIFDEYSDNTSGTAQQ